MSAILAMGFGEYMEFYRSYAIKKWNHMTPMQFCFVLIAIAIMGFLMMRSGTKRV